MYRRCEPRLTSALPCAPQPRRSGGAQAADQPGRPAEQGGRARVRWHTAIKTFIAPSPHPLHPHPHPSCPPPCSASCSPAPPLSRSLPPSFSSASSLLLSSAVAVLPRASPLCTPAGMTRQLLLGGLCAPIPYASPSQCRLCGRQLDGRPDRDGGRAAAAGGECCSPLCL